MNAPSVRASAALRWVNCPEAAWLEAQYPDKESDAAREGTAAHQMAEMILNETVTSPEELFNRQAKNGVIWVEEMSEPVMTYVNHVRSHGVSFWIEEAIQFDIITGICDGAAFSFNQDQGILYIDDFKYGRGLVEVYQNWQLLIYAIGIMHKHQLGDRLKQVVMTIVQPRGWHHDGPIRSWSISNDELYSYHQCIVQAARRVTAPERVCNTGSHCRYCKALAFCNAAKTASMNAIDVSEAALPDMDTPEQVATLMDELKRASEAIDHLQTAVRSRAISMIRNGQPVPSYILQPGIGKRKWNSESDALAMGVALGVTMKTEKVVTPAQAERNGLSKEIVKAMTFTPSTEPKLIKSNNINKAKEVFNDVKSS